jgi:hypothetical protein
VKIAFDLMNVRTLQEDMNAKYKRLGTATAHQAFMKRNEARTEIGLDPIEEWEEEGLSPPAVAATVWE